MSKQHKWHAVPIYAQSRSFYRQYMHTQRLNYCLFMSIKSPATRTRNYSPVIISSYIHFCIFSITRSLRTRTSRIPLQIRWQLKSDFLILWFLCALFLRELCFNALARLWQTGQWDRWGGRNIKQQQKHVATGLNCNWQSISTKEIFHHQLDWPYTAAWQVLESWMRQSIDWSQKAASFKFMMAQHKKWKHILFGENIIFHVRPFDLWISQKERSKDCLKM